MPTNTLNGSTSVSSPDSGTAGAQVASYSQTSIQKNFSCFLCAQRKVKCDKAPGGCSNCAKARVSCIYKAPPPPRRRKKGTRELDVHSRLRIYEDALRKLGVDPTELENTEFSQLREKKGAAKEDRVLDVVMPEHPESENGHKGRVEAGMLVSDEGKSRYLDNGLWMTLKAEFRDPKEILDDTSSEDDEGDGVYQSVPQHTSLLDTGDVLLGLSPRTPASLRAFHPQPVQIFKLWQTYLGNVNPLVKVFHAPTIQQVMLNATCNMDDIPKNVEALMFSIYCAALCSIGEVECEAIMGEPKAIVDQRFRSGAQIALVNAGFLKTSNIMILQAFVLFLTSLQLYDARIMWILTGIAARIGQRIGLHRDGETLGLPPFDVEMRRRLWWQILFLEGFSEKLAGAGGNIFMGDTKKPTNVNDSDLFHGMKDPPKDQDGATEMMFFLIRCHVGEFLRRPGNHTRQGNYDGVWNKLSTQVTPLAIKTTAIDELEAMFERKYLRYIDNSVPWHFMCEHLAKAVVYMMRFIAHNRDSNGHAHHFTLNDPAQSEKDGLFQIAMKVVTYQNLAYTVKEMQGYIWHVNTHFQWKAFIYIVSELRYRTGQEAEEAWKQVKLVYDFHPNFKKEMAKRALPIAIGTLTLKAWDAYAEKKTAAEGILVEEPYFIRCMRLQRQKSSDHRTARSNRQAPTPESSSGPVPETLQQYQQNLHRNSTQYQNNIDNSVSVQQENQQTFTTNTSPDPLRAFHWGVDVGSRLRGSPPLAQAAPAPTFPQFHGGANDLGNALQSDLNLQATVALQEDLSFQAEMGIDGMSPSLLDPTLLDPERMDWSAWDNLLVDFQTVDAVAIPGPGVIFNVGGG